MSLQVIPGGFTLHAWISPLAVTPAAFSANTEQRSPFGSGALGLGLLLFRISMDCSITQHWEPALRS